MAIPLIIAGLGPRGSEWAREVLRDPGFDLVAIADVDAAALRSAGERLGIAARFLRLEDATDAVPCKAVLIATSPDAHEHGCRIAIERGTALLVEKPFTLEVDRAVSIVQSAEAAGVPIVVGQNYRYMRAWRTVKQVIESGRLGNVTSAACHYYRVPHEMAASLARLDSSVLWGAGIHHLDALRYVLGRPVTAVSADIFTTSNSNARGASIHALLELGETTRAVYVASYESSGHEFFERGQEFYARFTGDRATLHVFHRWLFLCEGRKLPRPLFRGRRTVTEEHHLLRQLERAILHGEMPESSGRDNLETLAIAGACVRSSRERRWVEPQELLE